MKKAWKWVIGIVLGLVILAVLVGVGFLVWGNMHVYRGVAQVNRGFSQRGPEMMPYGGFGYHMRGPGMMGYRMNPFGAFFGGLLMLRLPCARDPWNHLVGGTCSRTEPGSNDTSGTTGKF